VSWKGNIRFGSAGVVKAWLNSSLVIAWVLFANGAGRMVGGDDAMAQAVSKKQRPSRCLKHDKERGVCVEEEINERNVVVKEQDKDDKKVG
jgi:hypothetical protein